jgi:exonuclease SbcC
MIPLRLSVRNFMCYREPPDLNLEPIQVACLCGPNGHGKSALLDAITWALWGEARAKTQDELIHQGQTDMSVELDFSARDSRYRVSRRHSRKKGKHGATMLELQIGSNGNFTPITGNTVRETEAAIRELLHMDYDTFVNTAFLLQGRADMFTAATPAKRKDVLAEVLDLGYYESLAAKARERSRERERRIADIDATVAAHTPEIDRKPGYEADLSNAEGQLRALDAELEPARKAMAEHRTGVDRLRGQRSDLAEMEARLSVARTDLAALEARAESQRTQLDELEALQANSAEIEARFAELHKAKGTVEIGDAALASLNELERERAGVERELAVGRERVSAELAREQAALAELIAAGDRLPQLEAAQTALGQDRNAATKLDRQAQEQRVALGDLKTEARVLEAEAANLRSQMADTRQRFDLLEAGEAQCPVCQQPLGDEGADHLRSEYEKEGKEAKARFSENMARTKQVADDAARTEAALAAAVAQAASAGQDVERRAAELDRDLTIAKRAIADLDGARARAAQVAASLKNEDFAKDAAAQLARLDAQIGELGYDAEAHRMAREAVAELEPYAALHIRLLDAVVALPKEREALISAQAMAERRGEEIAQDSKAAVELAAGLEGLAAMEAELAAAVRLAAGLETRRTALTETLGGLRERIARSVQLEATVAEQTKRRKKDSDERSIYDELVRAFGKNGIQALVIETAIPQIEDQATGLLRRLTDGRMSLKLELRAGRRERRTGEPSEQLEILIGDEMGTRSYETFSGGEAFRINFALRIALSKLLAARSGAPLPVLFIDEGFGSQDKIGQDGLVDVIKSIQDDFQKILVVTHIEELKYSFTERIEVEKTGAGSTFTVTTPFGQA